MRLFSSRKRIDEEQRGANLRDLYTVVVHEEDGGLWGEVPELPGCASQGTTLDELFANIIDAIQGCLEVHLEDEGPHARQRVFTMNVPVSYPAQALPPQVAH